MIKKEVKQAYNTIRKNISITAISVFIDTVFLLITMLFTGWAGLNVMTALEAITNIITENAENISGSNLAGILMKNPEFVAHYTTMLKYVGIFLLLLYISLSLFQGINWYLANRMRKPLKFWPYYGKFFLVSLVWYIIFVIAGFVTVRVSMSASFAVFPAVSQSSINYIMFAVFAVLGYFALCTYSILHRYSILETLKQTFIKGIKNFKIFAQAYILSIALLVILFIILTSLTSNIQINTVLFIFIELPVVAFTRVLLIESAR